MGDGVGLQWIIISLRSGMFGDQISCLVCVCVCVYVLYSSLVVIFLGHLVLLGEYAALGIIIAMQTSAWFYHKVTKMDVASC